MYESDGTTSVAGNFAASTVYVAKVTLIAKEGYTFTGVEENSFTYTGATSVTNAANSGVVTISFPATEATTANNAPTVVGGDENQSGNETTAAASGTPAAVAYIADVSAWFEDVNAGDTLTYSVVSAVDDDTTDVSSNVNITGNTITYTPDADQAEKTVIIVVKANDGTADSTGNVTITLSVAAVPSDN